jgi:hypothetical protein
MQEILIMCNTVLIFSERLSATWEQRACSMKGNSGTKGKCDQVFTLVLVFRLTLLVGRWIEVA